MRAHPPRLFNFGGRTRMLPWFLLHPGAWSAFPILRHLARARPPDMSARDFIDHHGYRGRARLLAEMVFTAHLPGIADEIGLLGLLEDRVLDLYTGSLHRVTDGTIAWSTTSRAGSTSASAFRSRASAGRRTA